MPRDKEFDECDITEFHWLWAVSQSCGSPSRNY